MGRGVGNRKPGFGYVGHDQGRQQRQKGSAAMLARSGHRIMAVMCDTNAGVGIRHRALPFGGRLYKVRDLFGGTSCPRIKAQAKAKRHHHDDNEAEDETCDDVEHLPGAFLSHEPEDHAGEKPASANALRNAASAATDSTVTKPAFKSASTLAAPSTSRIAAATPRAQPPHVILGIWNAIMVISNFRRICCAIPEHGVSTCWKVKGRGTTLRDR